MHATRVGSLSRAPPPPSPPPPPPRSPTSVYDVDDRLAGGVEEEGGSETIRRSLCKSTPLSLDWRYDPRESVIPLPSGDFDRRGATRRLCHPRPTIDRQDAIARRRAGGGGRRAEVSSSLIRSDIDSSYRIRPCRWRTCRRPSNRRSRRGWIDETDVNC